MGSAGTKVMPACTTHTSPPAYFAPAPHWTFPPCPPHSPVLRLSSRPCLPRSAPASTSTGVPSVAGTTVSSWLCCRSCRGALHFKGEQRFVGKGQGQHSTRSIQLLVQQMRIG